MKTDIKIILTADDYGMSVVFDNVINRLIVEGVITSTSVLIGRLKASYLCNCQNLLDIAISNNVTLGLHFEAKEGDDFKNKLNEQYSKFIKFFSRKPDYIDVHAPHKLGGNNVFVWQLINSLGLPVRNMGQNTSNNLTTTSVALIATNMSKSEIITWISYLEPGEHEIVFHPGDYDPDCKSSLNEKRIDDSIMVKDIRSYIEANPKLNCCNFKF